MSWQDNRFEAAKVEWMVASDYKTGARQLLGREFRAFATDVYLDGHPPGYPIVRAAIFRIFGESDTATQFLQIVVDALAAVLVILICFELFGNGVGIIAGLMAAVSPQFAYYPLLLLPDSLAVAPILLAIYFIIRASKRPRLVMMIGAGVCIGISCWLRANALLLSPFLAIAMPVLFRRGQRLRCAAALIAATLIVIAPITIKNYVVFRHFIPLSLGAGQKLLQGIAEYDEEGRFGIPRTDLGIIRQEAEVYQRPDYGEVLFGPDGVQRDRMRLARGVAVIRSHPFWYFGVMLRRAASFFRLARAPILSREPPVTHPLELAAQTPIWSSPPDELLANCRLTSEQVAASLSADGKLLQVLGDDSKYGDQIVCAPIAVQPHHDYLLRVPLMLRQGRLIVKLTGGEQNVLLASTIVDLVEGKSSQEQPTNLITIPFVSGDSKQVRVVLGNGGSRPVRPMTQLGRIQVFELGPSSYSWTHYPRLLIGSAQRFFVTAWILPLVILGSALLVRSRQFRTLVILWIVPAYYLCTQSALHTERRYVITIHYFLFMVAAVALWRLIRILWGRIQWLGQALRKMIPLFEHRAPSL